MSKGISTDQKIGDKATCLKQAGLDFVVRYYSAIAWKRMELPEAKALAWAGLRLVAVYEDGPKEGLQTGYFTAQRGKRAAATAFQFAADVIHQPFGSAIYFAVDYDYTSKSDLAGVVDYFKSVQKVFADESADDASKSYQIGVYGSSIVCKLIKETEGIASFSWLAESTGWGNGGYAAYKAQCDIIQSIRSDSLCGLTDYEDCTTSKDDFGGFALRSDNLPLALENLVSRNPNRAG